MASYRADLFVPPQQSTLASAASWFADVATGSLATSVAVIAIAALGIMLMAGKLQLRDGLRIVVGCFVLFGAAAIANGILGLAVDRDAAVVSQQSLQTSAPPAAPPRNLPPAGYDPYAGASVPQD